MYCHDDNNDNDKLKYEEAKFMLQTYFSYVLFLIS